MREIKLTYFWFSLDSRKKMDKLKVSLLAVICFHIAICGASSEESDDVVAPIDDVVAPPNDDLPGEEVQPEKLEYAKGSLCGYCTYCEVC